MKFDPPSLAVLYLEERAKLRRRYMRRGLSMEAAADLVQEAFMRLSMASLEGMKSPKAYLYRVADNLFVDEIRNLGRSRAVFPDHAQLDEEAPDLRPSVEASLIAREEEQALDQALADLPPRCREVVRLHKFEGLSYVEISQKMGVSRNTVMVHMVKGLGALRRRLRDEDRDSRDDSGGEAEEA